LCTRSLAGGARRGPQPGGPGQPAEGGRPAVTRRDSTGAVGPGPGRRSVEIMEGPPSCLARRQLLAAAAKVQMATPGAEFKFDLHEAVALSLPRNAQRPRRRHRPCWHLWNAHNLLNPQGRVGPAQPGEIYSAPLSRAATMTLGLSRLRSICANASKSSTALSDSTPERGQACAHSWGTGKGVAATRRYKRTNFREGACQCEMRDATHLCGRSTLCALTVGTVESS
jgi:hypothetical protein